MESNSPDVPKENSLKTSSFFKGALMAVSVPVVLASAGYMKDFMGPEEANLAWYCLIVLGGIGGIFEARAIIAARARHKDLPQDRNG